MLKQIAEKLGGLVDETWVKQMEQRGRDVRLFRDYYDGKHRLKLTDEMRKMMQIDDEQIDRYNDNYCEMVVDAVADRLTLTGVEPVTAEAEEPADASQNGAAPRDFTAQDWAKKLTRINRLDGLQIRVREAVFRDGETFVMSQAAETGALFYHEEVWDGVTGILPVYNETGDSLLAAAKVWIDSAGTRVNVYFSGRTLKYIVREGSTLELMAAVDTRRDGEAPGVPLVAFRNRANGRSEITNVLPLQDSLNRTLISMVMSAELTAFAVLFAKGWKPPAAITPGMIFNAMVAGADGEPIVTDNPEEANAYAALNDSYDLERIEGGSLEQLISQADWLIEQIATVSSTPIPSQMGGSSSSGEALKERSARLISKAQRAQVQLGNAWEDLWALAHRQETLFLVDKPPAVEGWISRWKTAEIRDDTNIRETARLLHDWGYEREALRVLGQSSVVEYDDARIDKLMAEKLRDTEAMFQAQAGELDGFDMFQVPA